MKKYYLPILLTAFIFILNACTPKPETTEVTMNNRLFFSYSFIPTNSFPTNNPPLYYINGAQIVPVYVGPALEPNDSIYTVASKNEPTKKPLQNGLSISCVETEPTTYEVTPEDAALIKKHQQIYDELWQGPGSTYNGHELFQWICEK